MELVHPKLALDSSDWGELQTAYGDAREIPALLASLQKFPASDLYQDEPWFSLWSALCHQGYVYTASFAAVPYIVDVLRTDPDRADFNYFQLPVCIELARVEKGIPVPVRLEFAYRAALSELPMLAAKAAKTGWSDDKCAVALAAIAVATGKYELARLLVEVESDTYESIVDGIFES